MKKYLSLIVLLCAFTVHAAGDADYPSVGLRHKITERPKSILMGVAIAVHLGFNIMSAYFQTQQMAFLQKIPYPDNEVGVPEEDKKCGQICRENAAQMRSNARHATNLNGFATATSSVSAISNIISLAIWTAMQIRWDNRRDYVGNVKKFAGIALAASVVNACFDIASTFVTVDSAIYNIGELPLKTLAPFEVAAFTGAGYWLPMALFGGYGLVTLAEFAEAGRVVIKRTYALLPTEPVAAPQVVTQQ